MSGCKGGGGAKAPELDRARTKNVEISLHLSPKGEHICKVNIPSIFFQFHRIKR